MVSGTASGETKESAVHVHISHAPFLRNTNVWLSFFRWRRSGPVYDGMGRNLGLLGLISESW